MDRQPQEALVRIGECLLDGARGILLREGEVVPVRAKTFALLNYLAENRGRVLSKDELLAAIWPDVIVSEDSLTQCIRDLRKALGDEEQQWIRTVSRRGYILADEGPAPAHPDSLPAPFFPAADVSDQPVVAVLPFAVAGDIDQIIVDGVIEEIINGLALFRTVTVIARASAFSFPVRDRPLPGVIGERLGADHLVDGTFRRTGTGFRVSVTLTHAPTARQIWGEQFDCAEADLFDIDAVIAHRIIVRLATNLEDSVLRRNAGRPPSSLKAFEHLVRGKAYLRGYDDNANSNAIACLRRSIEIDPEFGLAQAYLALAELIEADFGAAPRAVLDAAFDRALLALSLAPEEARCYRIMGMIQLYRREHGAAESFMRRALDLNPYDADALAQMGYILNMRGRADEGLIWLQRAIELNPYRPAWYDDDTVFALYALGRYSEAIEVQGRIPDNGIFHSTKLAATYAMQGDLAKAATHIGNAIAREPDLDLPDYFRKVTEYEHVRDLQHLLDGIEMALDAYRSRS